MDLDRQIIQLKNDKRRIDKNIATHKKKFIDEIKQGLGEEIKKSIVKKEIKEVKEEPQNKGLFRKMKEWILNLSKK
jgi:hypothetical protein